MKIGIFDSGLGGLIVARAIRKLMPEYDYVYLGDTKRVPYGNRSHDAVYEFTKEGVDYLFRKENCAIIIIACNTASARALRKIQKKYLPELENALRRSHTILEGQDLSGSSEYSSEHIPAARKVLGVLIPAAEEAAKYKRVGVIATLGTVVSLAFPKEIQKKNKKVLVFQNPAPMLVPLAEEGEKVLAKEFLKKYLKPLLNKKINALALGCTHYPIFKSEIKKLLPKNARSGESGMKIISQDEIIPRKLKEYLKNHTEISKKLSKNGSAKILVTDRTQTIDKLTHKWFGQNVKPKLIHL